MFSVIFSISVIKICRYIRFHPITWHKRIGMRAAILGCRHKGDCGAGFMQVNSGSSCGKTFCHSNSTYIESMICISFTNQTEISKFNAHLNKDQLTTQIFYRAFYVETNGTKQLCSLVTFMKFAHII